MRVGWFTCPAFLCFDLWRALSPLLFNYRCLPVVINDLSRSSLWYFYSLGIKHLFPFVGSSPSDIVGPGYGRLFVQVSLDKADRPITRSFRHSANVIHGGSSLSDIPFGREPHRTSFLNIWSVFPVLSAHLCLSCSVAQFESSTWFYCALWSAFGLSRISSFTRSLPVLSKTQLQKAFSLDAGTLSPSDTHYLNRHMV